MTKPKRKKERSARTKKGIEPLEGEVLPREAHESEEGDELKLEEAKEVEAVEVLPAVEEVDEEDVEVVPDVLSPPIPAPSRDIVPLDALSVYLRDISRYPHLSREEEQAIARKYYEAKDVEAAYKLVTSNLWLVVKIARDYERAVRNLLDLIQEGNIGLMEAVKNFDPYRGVRFPSYAAWWIKAYILRFVIANWRMVKLGTTQAQRKLFFNLKKEKERLEKEGFHPGPKLLAEKLNVKESEIVEMEQRMGSPDVSVDAPLQDDSDSNFLSVLPSDSLSAEDLLAQKEVREGFQRTLDEFASTLNERELIIFRERLLGEEKATLHEIAERFKVSKERVRQVESRLLEKLKTYLLKNMGSQVANLDLDS